MAAVQKQFALAQHFLRCPELVRSLICESTISQVDTVVEIGPGEGIITSALAAVAHRVVAVEKDPVLATRLHRRFQSVQHVEIIQGDFLKQQLGLSEYKIFANLPFNCTAQIMRYIVDGSQPPQAAYLIMQQEAAQKFAGWPMETQFSVLIKPWFDLHILRRLQRTDFDPVPTVDSALLELKQRGPPLIAPRAAVLYRRFVTYGFCRGKHNLRLTYKPIFSYVQWKRLAHDLGFTLNATPTQLSFAQWYGLFTYFSQHLPPEKQAIIMGNSRYAGLD